MKLVPSKSGVATSGGAMIASTSFIYMPWKLISGTVAANAVIRPLAVDMRLSASRRIRGDAQTFGCLPGQRNEAGARVHHHRSYLSVDQDIDVVLPVGVGAKNGLAKARAFLRDHALSRHRGRRDDGGAGRIDPWLDAIGEQLRREQGNRERADEEEGGGLQHGVALDGRPARDFERNRHCRRRGQRFCKYARIKLTGPRGAKIRGAAVGAVADRAASARLTLSENEALYDGRAQRTRLQHSPLSRATRSHGELFGARRGRRNDDTAGRSRGSATGPARTRPDRLRA